MKMHPLAIAIPTPLLDDIKLAAENMEMTQAQVIRLAVNIGLSSMKKINYNLVEAVLSTESSSFPNAVQERKAVKFKAARK